MSLGRFSAWLLLCVTLCATQEAAAQASGWLAPNYDHFGFAYYNPWREGGVAPGSRLNWSYAFGQGSSFGMGVANNRDFEQDRQVSLFGRYSLTPDWAFSAEMLSRDSTGLRPQDVRFGLQRRF